MAKTAKIILSLFTFFLAGGLVYAVTKDGEISTTGNRYNDSCGITLPEPKGYVNDFYGLFGAEEKYFLDSMIGAFEKETTNQVAIIIVDSAMMGKCDIWEYSKAIGNKWGVGQKNKNNGIVIGIAPQLRDMSIRNGYGIERIMSNETTKMIIDSIFIPEFKKADYFEGTRKGLDAIITHIKKHSL